MTSLLANLSRFVLIVASFAIFFFVLVLVHAPILLLTPTLWWVHTQRIHTHSLVACYEGLELVTVCRVC
jgi:hypothetical protein